MKKNIQINLFGTLYNIDEDAYQLLENYLESMKRYFGRQEGGAEIADDIEHRVAEILWTKKEAGMEAVNNEVIREIIAQIGNPEEIGGDEGSGNTEESGQSTTGEQQAEGTESGQSTWQQAFDRAASQAQNTARDAYEHVQNNTKGKKLYRNPQDKILGGVCSGLAAFFGGDVALWRVILAAAFLLEGVGLLLYIILWVLVPLARTPEDRLRMSGQTVTPDTLNSQILQDQYTTPIQHENKGCVKGCLAVFIILVCIPFFITVLSLIVGIGGSVLGHLFGFSFNVLGGIMNLLFGFPGMVLHHNGIFWWGVLLLLLGVGLLLFCLIHHFKRNRTPMSNSARVVFAIIILVCILLGVRDIRMGQVMHNDEVSPSLINWGWHTNKTIYLDGMDEEDEDELEALDEALETLDSVDMVINDSTGNIHAGPVNMQLGPQGVSIKVNRNRKVITN